MDRERPWYKKGRIPIKKQQGSNMKGLTDNVKVRTAAVTETRSLQAFVKRTSITQLWWGCLGKLCACMPGMQAEQRRYFDSIMGGAECTLTTAWAHQGRASRLIIDSKDHRLTGPRWTRCRGWGTSRIWAQNCIKSCKWRNTGDCFGVSCLGHLLIQVQMLLWFESKMSPDLYFEHLCSSDGTLERQQTLNRK